jgi:hypothetical protein
MSISLLSISSPSEYEPKTTKDLIGPQFYDQASNKTYIVTNITEINMSCVDPTPLLNGTTIYYRYYVDEQMIQNWTEYTGPFTFPEESKHTLEYYCVDAVGNKDSHMEIDYVNNTIQDTEKTCNDYGCSLIIQGYGKYFSIGLNVFSLPKSMLDDINFSCGVEPYYVENVTESIAGGFKSIWHYNGHDWDYYEPGYAYNDLTVFNDEIGNPYFIYMNTEDRLEINSC